MKAAIGCDHAGISLKNEILPILEELAIEWKNFGTDSEESVDYPAKMSRLHNDANVLILPGRVIDNEAAKIIVKIWFSTPFEGGRHQRRLDKIKAIEAKVKCL